MSLIGLAEGTATINPAIWLVKEVQVRSSLAFSHEDFERSMSMIADGRIQLDPLHSATIGLDRLGAALADLASGQSAETKVLVSPTA
jgi:(R,R)-butanediol dehydrogenase/meso-butanediol dehydrogenase/diacetyl reductase